MERCNYIPPENNRRPQTKVVSPCGSFPVRGSSRDPRIAKRDSNNEQGSSPGSTGDSFKGVSKAKRNVKLPTAGAPKPLDIINNPKPPVVERPNIIRPVRRAMRRPEPRIIRLHKDDKSSENSNLPEKMSKIEPRTEIPENERITMLLDRLDLRFPGFYIRTHSIYDNQIIPFFPFFDG